jgi:putative transposase
MPRKSRIDAPGALHHIVIRGIERKAIFRDKQDYNNFIGRLGNIFTDTSTPCYAWTLMTNHVHLLLKTGLAPISTVMRRLLTGYAQQFNRRHKRHGHLFQNRYKSFLCEKDPYLLELVRYIHLNPIRARIVKDLKALSTYPNCGHSVLMGKTEQKWQDTEYVLSLFGKTVFSARRTYMDYVQRGVELGERPELVGGGLLRSIGGWSELKACRKEGTRIISDERILGSSDFVEKVLEKTGEDYENKIRLKVKGITIENLISETTSYFEIEPEDIRGTSKERAISKARSIICYLGGHWINMSQAELARRLGISASTVSKAAIRGRRDRISQRIKERLLGK